MTLDLYKLSSSLSNNIREMTTSERRRYHSEDDTSQKIISDRRQMLFCPQVKTLAQDTIIANARFFGGDEALVPKQVKKILS